MSGVMESVIVVERRVIFWGRGDYVRVRGGRI